MTKTLTIALGVAFVLLAAAPRDHDDDDDILFAESRIYWEYNHSGNDLGVHVSLDGQNWSRFKIINPDGKVLFNVKGKGPYKKLGMTELFFEGAEPSLDDVPLDDLLAMFPEGEYEFEGRTTEGEEIEGEWEFTHAIPDAPDVFADVGRGDYLRISWTEVTGPPAGFPDRDIEIIGYQVIVEDFQVTVPEDVFAVTVPAEYVATLERGEHEFEVLAIHASTSQTITEGDFEL